MKIAVKAWLTIFCGLVALQSFGQTTWLRTAAPTNSWRLIACSADGNQLIASADVAKTVWISTNSGATWRLTHLPSKFWTSFALSADGTKIVAAASHPATSGGIYVSRDSGATWTITDLPDLCWSSVAISGDGSKLIAVAVRGDTPGAVYTSADFGWTWTQCKNIDASAFWDSVVLSVDGSKAILVSADHMYRSMDGGSTWSLLATPPPISGGASPACLLASSQDGSTLFFADHSPTGGLIYRSTDFGMTWTATAAPKASWTFIASSDEGKTVMVLPSAYQSGPLYVSTDSGQSWTTNSPTQVWCDVACSADGRRLFASSQGTTIMSRDGAIYVLGPANRPVNDESISARLFILTNWQYHVMPATPANRFYRLRTP